MFCFNFVYISKLNYIFAMSHSLCWFNEIFDVYKSLQYISGVNYYTKYEMLCVLGIETSGSVAQSIENYCFWYSRRKIQLRDFNHKFSPCLFEIAGGVHILTVISRLMLLWTCEAWWLYSNRSTRFPVYQILEINGRLLLSTLLP